MKQIRSIVSFWALTFGGKAFLIISLSATPNVLSRAVLKCVSMALSRVVIFISVTLTCSPFDCAVTPASCSDQNSTGRQVLTAGLCKSGSIRTCVHWTDLHTVLATPERVCWFDLNSSLVHLHKKAQPLSWATL